MVTEPVELSSLRLSFTRVADPDRVLDDIAADEDRRERATGRRASDDQLHLPYWAELWDSAFGIGQFLVRNRTEDSGLRTQPERAIPRSVLSRSVLDLGCGMGFAGTVAAACGHRVLFADLESPALLFARLNSLTWRQRVRTRQLNWRTDRLDERFDLILGADILYERKQWDHLEPFWRAHLADNGSVLLGEPGRRTGELFVDWIRERGWNLGELAEPVETRSNPIRLFRLTLRR